MTDENPRQCPSCSSANTRIVSVIGDATMLTTKRFCTACDHKWARFKERDDICEHGRILFVPCADCGRTWQDVEKADDITEANKPELL